MKAEEGKQAAEGQTGQDRQLIAPVLAPLARAGEREGDEEGGRRGVWGLLSKPFTGDRVQDAASLIFAQHQAPSEAFLEKCCHRNQAAVQIARGRPAAMVAGAGAGAGKASAAVPGGRIPHPPSSAPSSLVRAAVVLPCQRGWCLPQWHLLPTCMSECQNHPCRQAAGHQPPERPGMEVHRSLGELAQGHATAISHHSSAQVMAPPPLLENKPERSEGETQLKGSP